MKGLLHNKKTVFAVFALAAAFFAFVFACVGYAYAWFLERDRTDMSGMDMPTVSGTLVQSVQYYTVSSVGNAEGGKTVREFSLVAEDASFSLGTAGEANTGFLVCINVADGALDRTQKVSVQTKTTSHLLGAGILTDEGNPLSNVVNFQICSDVTVSGDNVSVGGFGTPCTLYDSTYAMQEKLLGSFSNQKKICIFIDYDLNTIDKIMTKNFGIAPSEYAFVCDFSIKVAE